jgi:hypothetical protein
MSNSGRSEVLRTWTNTVRSLARTGSRKIDSVILVCTSRVRLLSAVVVAAQPASSRLSPIPAAARRPGRAASDPFSARPALD